MGTYNKALLIGNNYYGDLQLSGCVNDAQNMEKYMKDKNYITTLHTEISHNDFINVCREFSSSAKQNEKLYFHFSGHGFQTSDKNGDEEDGLDEAVVLRDGTGFSDDDINTVLVKPLKSLKVILVLVFDTCHSGTMCDLRYTYNSGKKYVKNPHYPAINATVISISGCGDTQTSADTVIEKIPQGALTGTMLNLLKRSAPNDNICDFMDKLRTNLRKTGYSQRPIMCSSRPIEHMTLRQVGLI